MKAECIIFPDIHGRDFWKKVLIEDCGWETHRFIFLGDYFDPYPREGITIDDAIINWYELMAAAKRWKRSRKHDTFIFLMGNHDAHYINTLFDRISGGCRKSSNRSIAYLLKSMFLQIACQLKVGDKNVLFSHAGVMSDWYQAHKEMIGDLNATNINNLTKSDEGWMALAECDRYRGGYLDYGSPLWADMRQRREHDNDLEGLDFDYQVVGHTQILDNEPIIFDHIADLDCHHAFALTSDFHFEKI